MADKEPPIDMMGILTEGETKKMPVSLGEWQRKRNEALRKRGLKETYGLSVKPGGKTPEDVAEEIRAQKEESHNRGLGRSKVRPTPKRF